MPRKNEEPKPNVELVENYVPQEEQGYVPLKPNPLQQVMLDVPLNDFACFGTAKGTGKSTGIVLKVQQLATLLKKDFNCLITRGSYQSLQEIQGLLLRHLSNTFPGTTYNAGENMFRIGGKESPFGTVELAFTAQSPIEQIRAQNRLQGRSKNVIIHDEAGVLPSPDFYDTLMGTLRAPAGVPTQVIWLANPGGPGHGWLKQRFAVPAGCPEPGMPKRFWSGDYERHVIFMTAGSDINPHIDLGQYRRSVELMAGGDQALLSALLRGDWLVDIGGAYFADCWSPSRCRFEVNPGDVDLFQAGAFVAMDHGNAAPSVAYLIIPNPPHTPKGTLVLADEFYVAGTTMGGQRDWLKGCYMPNAQQGRALLEWLEPWCVRGRHNPGHVPVHLDDACWNANGSHQGSVAGDFKAVGVRVKKAEKMQTKMASGLSVMRSRMAATKKDAEAPWLMWSPNCQGFEATVPTLPKHPRDPELIADGCPDHACDAARYGIAIYTRRWAVGNSNFLVY